MSASSAATEIMKTARLSSRPVASLSRGAGPPPDPWLSRGARHRLVERDRGRDLKVSIASLAEDRRRSDTRDDVEIAGRPAERPVLALPRDADPAPVVNARGNLHPVALALGGEAAAPARLAGLLDHLAATAAPRARLADREETLALTDDAAPAALRARDRGRAGAGARAAARLARPLLRHRDRYLGPGH